MGKKWESKRAEMASKPRPLGYTAVQIIDDAIMSNQMCLNKLATILANNLTAEGQLRAVGLALKEASEVQGKLNQVRYLGK